MKQMICEGETCIFFAWSNGKVVFELKLSVRGVLKGKEPLMWCQPHHIPTYFKLHVGSIMRTTVELVQSYSS